MSKLEFFPKKQLGDFHLFYARVVKKKSYLAHLAHMLTRIDSAVEDPCFTDCIDIQIKERET